MKLEEIQKGLNTKYGRIKYISIDDIGEFCMIHNETPNCWLRIYVKDLLRTDIKYAKPATKSVEPG